MISRVYLLGMLVMSIVGCATTSVPRERIDAVMESKEDALLLVSLPSTFSMDYLFYKKSSESLRYIATLRSGSFDKTNLKEMPAGDYIVLGRRYGGTSTSMTMYGGGFLAIFGNDFTPIEIVLSARLVPGRLNYVGEIVITKKELSDMDSVRISNQLNRDLESIGLSSRFKQQEIEVALAERLPFDVKEVDGKLVYEIGSVDYEKKKVQNEE